MYCEESLPALPSLSLHSNLPTVLARARSPLEVLSALAHEGAHFDLDLWAMATVRDGEPAVYLCSLAPLSPNTAGGHLSHFVASASTLECPGALLMPDWAMAPQQVVCLQPALPVVAQDLAEYRDTYLPTGASTGAIVRAATLDSGATAPSATWSRLQVMLQYAAPYLRAMDMVNSDTARGMVDVESGTYSWPYFIDALEREIDRARRQTDELSLAVVDLRPLRSLEEIPAQLHRRVGAHVTGAVRHSDLVGRIGKRSFSVFFHHTGPRPALIAAGRILEALRADEEIAGVLSFSIGISGWEGTGTVEPCTLLSQAGEAAQEAAASGSGKAFVYI